VSAPATRPQALHDDSFVLVACGLALEARIAGGPGVRSVAGGVDKRRLARELERAVTAGARAILSFGIAGGLVPGIAAGTWIVARGVHTAAGYRQCDAVWTEQLAGRLPGALLGDLAGSDQPVADAGAKHALHAVTSALAVDTESHVAAEVAAAHSLPFTAFRVVADAAMRNLPEAALVGLDADGGVDIAAVLRSVVRTPSQLPLLMRTAIDARTAFAALRRGRRRLGVAFGCDVCSRAMPTPS
jgi:adenosylhomocysteine nucleosidase